MKTLATALLLTCAAWANPVIAGDGAALAEWASAVQQRIMSNWLRPPSHPEASPPCRVYIKISDTGIVESAEFKEPCVSSAFEQSVLQAVQRSSPLPLPRESSLFTRSLVLNFQVRRSGADN
jgi:colicin import membrane protein